MHDASENLGTEHRAAFGQLRRKVVLADSDPLLQSGLAAADTSDLDVISARDFEILRLLGLGKSTKEITAPFGISEKTVFAQRNAHQPT